ncbi:hypothetical protein [Kitasatospora sp. NPDC057541]
MAERIGVSQLHVSGLLSATLAHLREQLDDRTADGGADGPPEPG